jgi:hypothetical protein
MIQVSRGNVEGSNSSISSIGISEEQISRLNEFEKVRFSVMDYSSLEFSFLLEETLSKLLESYKIYLIYVESKAQVKNKVRSHKKMFYSQKRETGLKESVIYEKEVDLDGGKSILVSSVKLTNANLKYIVNNLLNSNFRFGYLVRKGKKSFSKNIESFLENVVNLILDHSKITRINFIDLLLSEVKKDKNIFRIPFGVNDRDFLEFLIRKEDENVRTKLSEIEDRFKKPIEN